MKGISEPAKYDSSHEAEVRKMIELHAAYAESGPTFDPSGRYLCGTCNMRQEPNACDQVEKRISMTVGGCRLYAIGEPMRMDSPLKYTQLAVGYSERPQAKGFGCSRCEYGSKAKAPDREGRPTWCSRWGCHVKLLACCDEESGPDLILAPARGDRLRYAG